MVKKNNFEMYEDFRKQLISTANLFQNYLKINNLLINAKKLEKWRNKKWMLIKNNYLKINNY